MMQHELGVPKTTEFAVKLGQRGVLFDRLPIKRQELIQMLKEAKK
ncbi:hypothetical protein AAFF39_03160 [Lactococcus garvieae]